jgi:hypothetical protein
MEDFNNAPHWMKAIPVVLGVAAGLYGASTANRNIVIFGMPAGFVIGFLIIGVLLKLKRK